RCTRSSARSWANSSTCTFKNSKGSWTNWRSKSPSSRPCSRNGRIPRRASWNGVSSSSCKKPTAWAGTPRTGAARAIGTCLSGGLRPCARKCQKLRPKSKLTGVGPAVVAREEKEQDQDQEYEEEDGQDKE